MVYLNNNDNLYYTDEEFTTLADRVEDFGNNGVYYYYIGGQGTSLNNGGSGLWNNVLYVRGVASPNYTGLVDGNPWGYVINGQYTSLADNGSGVWNNAFYVGGVASPNYTGYVDFGYAQGAYYINSQETTLDSNGNGFWDSKAYNSGSEQPTGWNGYFYYINNAETSLDASGNGFWNGLLYYYANLFTGHLGYGEMADYQDGYFIEGVLTTLNSYGNGAWNGQTYVNGVVQGGGGGGSVNLESGLQAFYKLSDTSDSSGNGNTLSNNGNVSFASGKVGNAAVFDGTNYLQITNPNAAGAEYSIAAWVNFSNFDSFQWVLSFGGHHGVCYHDGVSPAELIFTPEDGQYVGVGTPSANEWHFIYAHRKANGDYAMSIDNNSLITGNSGETYDSAIQIGNLLNGQIDAVGIWNRALTEQEVAELYNNGTGLELEVQAPVVDLESGLQAFYKLSDTSDSSGNNRTLTNNGNVSFASGKVGNAAVFDRSNWLSVENANTGETTASFFCWAKMTYSDYPLYCFGMSGIQDDGTWVLFYHGYQEILRFGSNFGEGWSDKAFGVSSIPQDEWAYVGFTYDGSNIRLYINGQIDSVTPYSGNFVRSTNNIYIGKDGSWNSLDFAGQIDAVGIWNRALSDAEVAALYNNGTGLELPAGPAVKNGWIDGIYWINDVATTLDQSGNGTWVGKLYENGSLFSGTKYELTFVDGVAQPVQIVTVTGNDIPVAFGLNEQSEPLVQLVFASITNAGETTVEQIVPTVIPAGIPAQYTVAQTVLAYSIDTTATFEGTINVDFVLPSNISQTVFNRVKCFHVKNNGTAEETPRVASDFATKKITIAISSFSSFLFMDEPPAATNNSVKVVGKSKFYGKVKFA